MKILAAGAEHTAAVTESGKLYGWGWGRYGNLGLGDRSDRLVPAEVAAVAVCSITPSLLEPVICCISLYAHPSLCASTWFISSLINCECSQYDCLGCVYLAGRADEYGSMWMASYYCYRKVRKPLHIWLEQVRPTRTWRL